MFCGSGGWKTRLAKAAGAEVAGQMRDEKLHAVAAQSRFGSEHVQNTILRPLLEVDMSKQCAPLWREAHVEVKNVKDLRSQTTVEIEMLNKHDTVWQEASSRVKMYKAPDGRATFGRFDVVLRGGGQGVQHFTKSE